MKAKAILDSRPVGILRVPRTPQTAPQVSDVEPAMSSQEIDFLVKQLSQQVAKPLSSSDFESLLQLRRLCFDLADALRKHAVRYQTDLVERRREIRRFANDIESSVRQFAALLPVTDFETLTAPVVADEYFSASELEESARREAKGDHHNMVVAMRDAGVIIANVLREHATRHMEQIVEIIAASELWPAQISIHSASNPCRGIQGPQKRS